MGEACLEEGGGGVGEVSLKCLNNLTKMFLFMMINLKRSLRITSVSLFKILDCV